MKNAISIPDNRIEEFREYKEEKFQLSDFVRFLSVYFLIFQHFSPVQIAPIVRIHVSHVRKIQRDFVAFGVSSLKAQKRGGRRRETMSLQEEEAFLVGFLEKAKSGHVINVTEIKVALEEMLGRTVHKTTVYRMLKRHNWRKIVPRPVHPKKNIESAEDFKKRASMKR